MTTGLNLFAIPAGAPFLDALAKEWLHRRGGDPLAIANGLILTPTRRSARALADAFLRMSDGRGLLLPRLVALGALDEAPLTLAGALDLPPAVDPHRRLAVLTQLILRMNGAGGAPRTADRAWILAAELATLMDEADRAEIDLAAKLPDAADPAFAQHWARTLEFLRIVTHAWPAWLEENGAMNPAAREVALLNAQAAAWLADPPDFPIAIAGTTAGIPAVARLARVVARLPEGCVVLPVLDTAMTDAEWAGMADSHPQAGLADLLAGLDATRADVRPWPWPGASGTGEKRLGAPDAAEKRPGAAGIGENPRFAMLSRALLPAAAMGAWQTPCVPALEGLSRLAPKDTQEEAEAIAMILRDAVQTPGRVAALVTPDRDLAIRVSAALPRHGIVADDSAGEPLSETPPAVFLRLLVRAVSESLAPVPLLALLKHPFAAAGLSPAACRRLARALEIATLRGPRPLPGLAGLRLGIAGKGPELSSFLARVEACLEPALRFDTGVLVAPAQALAAAIAAAENLAATDLAQGDAVLWADEEGEALSTILAAALDAFEHLPDQHPDVLAGLIDALLQGEMVRSRRALRGRVGAEHPRVFIWGPLEARLQSVDTIVLGGLAETIWPPAPEPGPWLSRPMRTKAGLPSPETAVGFAAHDFLAAAMSAATVVLSCPLRRDGAPAVPARWLTRLDALLAGAKTALPLHPAVSWARAQDVPAGGPVPSRPPRPCPPVAVRPTRLSVTEIETWLRDPYAIYAKHILKLTKLKDLDQETDAIDYGNLVHEGLNIFLREAGPDWPADAADAAERLREAMRRALVGSFARPALMAWWEPRLERIAGWVASLETRRRAAMPLTALATEHAGRLLLRRPERTFSLTARADRIERRADGQLAFLDYKTGLVPAEKSVASGIAPQLPLEAGMASLGGFGDEWRGETAELAYWALKGGFEPGKETVLFHKKDSERQAAIDTALRGLETLIAQYDEPDRCYLAQPDPSWTPRFSDYAQLERVAEWAMAVEEDEP